MFHDNLVKDRFISKNQSNEIRDIKRPIITSNDKIPKIFVILSKNTGRIKSIICRFVKSIIYPQNQKQ